MRRLLRSCDLEINKDASTFSDWGALPKFFSPGVKSGKKIVKKIILLILVSSSSLLTWKIHFETARNRDKIAKNGSPFYFFFSILVEFGLVWFGLSFLAIFQVETVMRF